MDNKMRRGAIGTWKRMAVRGVCAVLAVGTLAHFALGGAEAGKYSERYAKVSSILVDRGIAAMDKNQTADAQKLFEEAIVANPQNAHGYSYLGYLHYRAGKSDVASKYFTAALSIDPNQLKALNWGGQADLTSSNLESAEAKLQRLSRICGPNCAEYKQLSEAVATYKSAKKTN